MNYFVKSDYKGHITNYELASFAAAVRFAAKLRYKHRVKTSVIIGKGDASTWDKTTWDEFYTDLIKGFKDEY